MRDMSDTSKATSPSELRNARRVQRLTRVPYVEALAALRRVKEATPIKKTEDARARTERLVSLACNLILEPEDGA